MACTICRTSRCRYLKVCLRSRVAAGIMWHSRRKSHLRQSAILLASIWSFFFLAAAIARSITFGGAENVLNYLARYTHRVAISNHRLVACENDRVSFRWRDYAHGGKKKVMTVSADEFLRRFLLHLLPKGLVRIRHFGLFANRRRETALARCRELLGTAACADRPEATNLLRCPACSGTMLVVQRITSAQLYFQPGLSLPTPQSCSVDSS